MPSKWTRRVWVANCCWLPRWTPRSPWKAARGYCDSISPCKHFRAFSMPALQREAAWAEERLLGALRQSVPQNGRVHLHTRENLITMVHEISTQIIRRGVIYVIVLVTWGQNKSLSNFLRYRNWCVFHGKQRHTQKFISLEKFSFLWNCNCNQSRKIIHKMFFMYVMFLWPTVPSPQG